MSVEKAFDEGWKAGLSGKPVECNPYSCEDVANFNAWDEGHSEATDEMIVACALMVGDEY